MQKTIVGHTVETLACKFLEQHALTFVERNFSCRLGEIDLIMFEAASNTLVFVEVRYRANALYGNATESVDRKKQQKLRRTVLRYLQKHADARTNARVDVVGVGNADSRDMNTLMSTQCVSEHFFGQHLVTWTRNAIEAE